MSDGPARTPTVETPWMNVNGQSPDPLDTKYDGVTLRDLLVSADHPTQRCGLCSLTFEEHMLRRGRDCERYRPPPRTPIQRGAVSAHWSAQLRAKVEASKERARMTVMVDDPDLETANCKDVEP